MRGLSINRGLLIICFSFGFLPKGSWGAGFESYSVPASSALVCPDVGSTTGCYVDVDNTANGADMNRLVAYAHATAWKTNGSAHAIGFEGTAALGNGWMLATLSAAASSSQLPPEITAEGGKVIVKFKGSALGTATADSRHYQVYGLWKLEIGPPSQTQVWTDGMSSNYGGATIGGGPMLLSTGGSAGSRQPSMGPMVTSEGAWCSDYTDTDSSCDWTISPAPLGSGVASFEQSVTIRMPLGKQYLIWWHAETLGDAAAVVDPVITVHPDHAQYVTLELNGIEPPTPAPGPLDGVDISALEARGYNIDLWRTLGFLQPTPSNRAPVADPGPDQVLTQVGTTVSLNGSQSYDDDGDAITYSWTFASKPALSQAVLNGATTATPTFIADIQGSYVIQLIVSDPSVASTPKTITVSFNNVKPTANSGTGQTATVGDLVTLDGSGSSDANLDPLTYQWSFSALPTGSLATLTNPTGTQSAFVPDQPGTYGVQLIVNDGFLSSDPSTVQIQVTSVLDDPLVTLVSDGIALIGSLDPVVFKNSNMQNSLINKLQAVIGDIQSNSYDDAVQKLKMDVVGKTDGCALSGAPDKNDWIITCGAQQPVYTNLMEIIEALMR